MPPKNNRLSRRNFLKLSAATSIYASGMPIPRIRRQNSTLRVAWGGAPATLDPLSASADTEIAFLNAVYDYLIDTNSRSELVPRLAKSWTASDDGMTYTLQLAEGVKFHDGSDLTVDDIIWTFDRLRGEGPTADLFATLTSVEAGDGNSVVFKLNATNPDFLYNLTDNHAVILKAQSQDLESTFNGTGPFKLSDYTKNDRATFTANSDYWGGAPTIGTLQFIYFDDVEAAANALRGNIVDVVLRVDNVTFLDLSNDGSFNAQSVPTSGHDLVRLRADREPGNKPEVRQAFKLATDRQVLFEKIQFGFGAVGRDSPISPVFSTYYTESTPIPPRDPDAARKLLEQAGYQNGLDMTLYVPNLPDRVALAEALAAQWKDAGINITIEPQEESVYYADNGWLEVDLGITPWGARPVPQVYLDLYLKTGAKWNESHFSDAELDQDIETAGTSLDEAVRVNAYHEIQRILIERGPIIVPYFFAAFGVMQNSVQGVDVHPFAGRTNFFKASV